MSDYRGMIEAADELHVTMRCRGIMMRTRTFYTTPDGEEYDTLSDAIEKAPIISDDEFEPVFDCGQIIAYKRAGT